MPSNQKCNLLAVSLCSLHCLHLTGQWGWLTSLTGRLWLSALQISLYTPTAPCMLTICQHIATGHLAFLKKDNLIGAPFLAVDRGRQG